MPGTGVNLTCPVMEPLEIMRVVGYPAPPYLEECFTEYPTGCPRPGVHATLLYYVLSYAGLQIEWVRAETREEAVEVLNNGTADMSAWTEPLDSKSFTDAHLHTSFPLAGEKLGFITQKRTSTTTSSRILVNLFPISVWAGLGLGWLVARFTALIIGELRYWLYSRKMVPQATTSINRMHLASWYMTLAILLGVYANLLAIGLARPPIKIVAAFKTLEELATKLKNGNCHLIAYESVTREFKTIFPDATAINETDKNSNITYLRESFLEAQKLNPATVLNNSDYANVRLALEELKTQLEFYDCPVIVDSESRLLSYESARVPELEVFPISFRDVTTDNQAYFYRARGHVRRMIEKAFSAGSVYELYKNIKRRLAFNITLYTQENNETLVLTPETVEKEEKNKDTKALTINHLMDTFWLMGGGLIIGIMILFGEVLLPADIINYEIQSALVRIKRRAQSNRHASILPPV